MPKKNAKKIHISSIDENIVFFNTYGLLQHWVKKNYFSFMNMPRPDHGFIYIMCDHAITVKKNGEKMNFSKGNLLYIPKGLEYTTSFYARKNPPGSLLINFSMTDRQNSELYFYDDITCLVDNASALFSDIFYKIIYAGRSSSSGYLSVMSAFYELLGCLSSHISKAEISESNIIAPALMYLDNNVTENPSVSELAKMCLLSETCFRKHFKRHTGYSPAEYKKRIKIQKAKQLLQITRIPISEIAYELGFYDTSYFYKIFEKEVGTTPLVYRNSFYKNG